MELDGLMHALGILFQVFLIDLLLSGDNAVVIALACRSLPVEQRREVILIGTVAGIVLRVLLTFVATFLLAVPSLKLIGGLALIYIALKLLADHKEPITPSTMKKYTSAKDRLWSAVGVVVFADLVMSVDNVVGLAAAAQGNIIYLIFGLMLSVPLLMYGSLFVTRLLNQYSILVPAVGALLGYLAGDIAVTDPLIADWVNTQSPALTVVVPLLCAVYVLYQGKILNEARPRQEYSEVEINWQDELSAVAPSMDEPVLARQTSEKQPAVKFDPSQKLAGLLEFYRSYMVLIVLSAIILPLIIFFALYSRALIPTPAELVRYDCPGYDGPFSIYYRHGVNHVQLRSGRHVIDGQLHERKIEWESNVSSTLGYSPPDEITEGERLLTVNGGYFSNINCNLSP